MTTRSKIVKKTTPITVSTKNIVKIWFSRPGEPPLGGKLNEYRLVQHRSKFPDDSITLLSNHTDAEFSAEDKMHIEAFCKEHGILLISLDDIQKELEDSFLRDKEQQLALLKIVHLEIDHACADLAAGSGLGKIALAAASDILRVLSPVIEKGIYTDFDIIKKQSASTMTAKYGFLLNMANIDRYSLDLTNSVLFCDESLSSFAEDYRAEMYKRYYEKEVVFSIFSNCPPQLLTYLEATVETLWKNPLFRDMPFAFLVRRVFQSIDGVSDAKREEYLKTWVIACTGPGCMLDTLKSRTCPGLFPGFSWNFFDLEEFKPISICEKYRFDDEEDLSWLPSQDTRIPKLLGMHNAATLFQAAYRGYKARQEGFGEKRLSSDFVEDSYPGLVEKSSSKFSTSP